MENACAAARRSAVYTFTKKRPSQSASAPFARLFRLGHVADVADGLNQRAAVAKLLTKGAHMHVDGAASPSKLNPYTRSMITLEITMPWFFIRA